MLEDPENSEVSILSFIIRIWREDADIEKDEKGWRGHLTLIPRGERQYFSDIKDIPAFIVAHLRAQQ